MANKKAKELKVGDEITIAGEKVIISAVEVSDIGKQGTKKVRIEAKKANGDKIVVIRPEDYPFVV
jgi:translation elongation factor P/translation initiation factor 5A